MLQNNSIEPFNIYTDGACPFNGVKTATGGWAYIITYDSSVILSDSGGIHNTTNNRMELTAIIEGIKAIIKHTHDQPNRSYHIYTDSAYAYNCYSQGWYYGWQANGWRNANKKEVLNQDLWLQLIPFFERSDFKFFKVKGHTDNYYNNQTDQMAVAAAKKFNMRTIDSYGGIPMWEDEDFLKCVNKQIVNF